MSKLKLKDLLSEVFEETPKVDKYKVSEGVRNYGIVGKQLYNNNNVMEIAKQLAEIAESAHSHVLGENEDWFDKVSVSRNMKSLKGNVMEFTKTAKESHMLNQRLTALYEKIKVIWIMMVLMNQMMKNIWIIKIKLLRKL